MNSLSWDVRPRVVFTDEEKDALADLVIEKHDRFADQQHAGLGQDALDELQEEIYILSKLLDKIRQL